MKEFIEYIAKHLVDSPDGVEVDEKVPEENKVVLSLKVQSDDVGKVIGKQGKTAQAMRTLLTAIAAKDGKRAILEILDQGIGWFSLLEDFYLVAKITSISGNGYLKLNLITDFPEKLFQTETLYIDFFGKKKKFEVENLIRQKKAYLIKFFGFETERELQVLLGREIFITEKELAELPEGSYFIHELIDSEVFRSGEKIGRVKDVLNLPANDVYLIVDENGNEILIPAVPDFIISFDAEKKIMIIKDDAGIYDDED